MRATGLEPSPRSYLGIRPVKGRLRSNALPLLFLLAAAIGFFWKSTLAGKVLLPLDNLYQFPPWSAYAPAGFSSPHNPLISDAILQNYGWKRLLLESIHQRQLPLWNPYVLAGTPFFAPGQASVLYPFTLLFLILPLAHAYGYFAALHLFLAGAFSYAYLRVVGISRAGGVIGGLAFMFSGRMVTSILWPQMIGAMVYLPLLLLIVELIFRQAHHRWPIVPAMAGAAVLGVSILAGHIEASVYVASAVVLYALGRLAVELLRNVGTSSTGKSSAGRYLIKTVVLLGAFIILGTGVAAVQLLPFYQVGSLNFRSGTVSYGQVVGFALKLPQIFTFLMPDFYGNPTIASAPGWGPKDYVEQAAYIGVLPLLLAFASLWKLWGDGKRRESSVDSAVALWGVVAVSLLLAFGTPLYRLVFFDFPGFNQIHTPFRWLIPYTGAMALLAGIGFDVVHRALPRWRWVFSAAAAAGLLALLPWSRIVMPHVPANYQWLETRNYAALLALLIAAAGISWLGGRAFALLAVALVIGDLAYFGINFNTAVSPGLLATTPESVRFLQRDQDLFRVTAFGPEKTLEPNGNMLYKLQDARGYDSVILRSYARFTGLIEQQDQLQFNRIANVEQPAALDSPLLDLLNVKYVLSARPIEDPHYRLVFDRPEMKIYQNLNALPRAFVVPNAEVLADDHAQLQALSSPDFDPSKMAIVDRPILPGLAGGHFEAAKVQQYSGRKVTVEASGPGLLVLSDNNFPGWKATVDGQPASLYTADYTFRGVALTSGKHRVEFTFSPPSVVLGGLGTGLSLALIALILGFYGWMNLLRRSPAVQLQTVSRVAKNSLTPMGSNLATKLLSFGFTIYYFPVLGASQIGKYTLAATINLFMDTIISFGLQQMVMRDVARDKQAANAYITSATALRLAVSAALGLPVVAGSLILHRIFGFELDTTLVIIILTCGFLPAAFSSVFSHVFDAFELMEYRAGINVLTGVMTVAFGLIFILAGWNIVGLAVASLLTNTVAAVVFYMLLSRIIVRPSFHWDGQLARRLALGAYPIMLNQLLVVLFFKIDVPILSALRNNREVGLYGTAYKFVDAMLIVPPAFIQAVFPILSRQAVSQRQSLKRGFDLSLKMLLLIAFPTVAGFEVMADAIIRGFYGAQFDGAIPALRILMLFLPFSYVNGLTQYVLIALDKQRAIVRFFAITAAFNVLVNLALIPSLGYIAASIVTVGSEVVLLVPLYWLTVRELGESSILQVAARPALAAAIAALVMLASRSLTSSPLPTLLVGASLGTAAYVAALLALRTFTSEELDLVRGLTKRQRALAPAGANN